MSVLVYQSLADTLAGNVSCYVYQHTVVTGVTLPPMDDLGDKVKRCNTE